MKDKDIFKPSNIFRANLLYRLEIAGRKCLQHLLSLFKKVVSWPIQKCEADNEWQERKRFQAENRNPKGKCNSSDVGMEGWDRNHRVQIPPIPEMAIMICISAWLLGDPVERCWCRACCCGAAVPCNACSREELIYAVRWEHQHPHVPQTGLGTWSVTQERKPR